MPHIDLPPELPGITSAFAFSPATAKPMRELAEVLLRGPNSLRAGMIQLCFVRNDCTFCRDSHRASAAHHRR